MQLDADNRFESPVMYVGAGTGIAPLRSLIQERETIRMLSTTSRHLNDQPDNILVFGSRKKSMDYYYGIEWGEMQNRGNLRVLNAFSQDQKHKLYVQKVLREADGGLLIAKHLLENNGALYIAGGAKMAQAVKDEVIECLGKVLPSGEKGGKIVLQKLQRAGRFSVEAWS
jgi:sulfite reductase alpha subunit-like flavoprotein